MKRTEFWSAVIAGLVLFAGTSFAATTLVSSPEISMSVPSYLSAVKTNYSGSFPSSALENFDTMNILVLTEQFPDMNSMQSSLAQLSAITFSSWALTDSADNDVRGWTWRREYQAEGPGGSVAYAVIGQGAAGSYIVMFFTGRDAYTANSEDFQTWRSSLNVLVAPPGPEQPPASPF